MSATINHVRIERMIVARPGIMTDILQPKISVKKARGIVAVNHPKPPMAIKAPEILAYSTGLNQTEKSRMVGIKIAETPRPTSTLEPTAKLNHGERPNKRVPMAASKAKRVIVFLDPHESESKPTGTCMIPYG